MTAQAYYDGAAIVRIFDKDGNMLADLPLELPSEKAADDALRLMKLRRRGKWEQMDWGLEAKIRFVK